MSDLSESNLPSNTFCSMAWNHQFLDPTGRVKPCCRFGEKARPKENNLNTNTLENIFFGEWQSEVRRKMLVGERVPGCERCYQEEDAGKRSLRMRYNNHNDKHFPLEKLVNLEKPAIKWLELAISNDCNLACRMCDSRYAWKWFKEEQAMFGRTQNKIEHSKSDIANVFPFIKDIMHIKFTGGEPLMTKDMWRLVDRIIDERGNDCKTDIFLNYSTNCTIMPKDEWIEKWNKFRLVEFAISLDSVDPKESEYIRWPAKFETTEAVARRFIKLKRDYNDNYAILLRSTISILNIWNTPETILWWYDNGNVGSTFMNPTHLTEPKILCLTVLPKNIKDRVNKKFTEFLEAHASHPKFDKIKTTLEYLIKFMYSSDDTHLLKELKQYIIKTDEYRNQDFFDSYPQFNDIFTGIE